LEQVFDHFLNGIKVLLADFNAKLVRQDVFKPTIGNESLPQDSNNNGVRRVNCRIKKASHLGHDVPAHKHSQIHLKLF
jgi:hypothetical protein